MNLPVMALELFDPVSVTAESTGITENETYPKASKIIFEFAANSKRGPVKMFWYDGGNVPGDDIVQGLKIPNSGSLTIGSEGKVYSPQDYGQGYSLLPELKFKEYKKPEPILPQSPGHYKEWAQAIATNDPTLAISNFEYATRLTETALLGNVALKAGGKIEWNAAEGKVTNNEAANKFIAREYRKGWTL